MDFMREGIGYLVACFNSLMPSEKLAPYDLLKEHNIYMKSLLNYVESLDCLQKNNDKLGMSYVFQKIERECKRIVSAFDDLSYNLWEIIDSYECMECTPDESVLTFYKKCHFPYTQEDADQDINVKTIRNIENKIQYLIKENNIFGKLSLEGITSEYSFFVYNFYTSSFSFHESIVKECREFWALTIRDVIHFVRIISDFFGRIALEFSGFSLYANLPILDNGK